MFNVVSTGIVNPDNESASIKVKENNVTNHYFPYSIAQKVPFMLRILALVYLVLCGIGIVLVGQMNKHTTEESSADEPMLPHLKSKKFWVLLLCCVCSSAGGLYVAPSYKNFGEMSIDDDAYMAVVGSVASVFNGSFRYIWAHLMDWRSFRLSYTCLLGLQTVMLASFYWVGSSKPLFIIWVSVLLCCEGGHFSLFAAVFGKIWGRELGAKLFGLFFFVFGTASIITFGIQLFVVSEVGYMPMFLVVSLLSFVSFAIMIVFQPERKVLTNSLLL